jgi:hypothetical protein
VIYECKDSVKCSLVDPITTTLTADELNLIWEYKDPANFYFDYDDAFETTDLDYTPYEWDEAYDFESVLGDDATFVFDFKQFDLAFYADAVW